MLRDLYAAALLMAFAPFACAQGTQTIRLDMSGTRPAITVSIGGGAPELFVFDTGAGGSVINLERAQALGLPEEQRVRVGSPIGGTPQEGFLTTLDGAVSDGVALPSLRIVAAPGLLPDRSGVISPNAFAGRLVTLDFGRAELRISEKSTDSLPPGEAFSYDASGRHAMPSLPVRIGAGETLQAHMDTGSAYALSLPYAMAASLPLEAPPVEAGQARFVDGARTRYRGRVLGAVQVGPITLENPEVDFIEGLPSINVGMGVLSRLVITLDPAERRSWAVPAQS